MKIHTKKQTRELAGYLTEVLEEMINRGYSPEIVNIELPTVKGRGVVYIAPGTPYSVGSPNDCVECLDRELTDTKSKAEKLIDDILKKAEEEDIPYELIQEMLKKATGDAVEGEE